MTPGEIIASYIEHLQDESFVVSAVDAHGVAALVDCVIGLLRGHDHQNVMDATLFIRDVSIGLFREEITNAFRERLPASDLFDVLDECLSVHGLRVRKQAVYTFGKLCYKENAGRLIRAFRDRRDHDPFLMGSLAFEIRWLEQDDEAHWSRIGWLAEAPDDVCRWATMLPVEQSVHQPNPHAERLLNALQQDRYRYIRDEARYWRAEMDRRSRKRGLTKAELKEWRRELKHEKAQLDALRPTMTFSDLEIRFWSGRQEPDYTTDDIRAFLSLEESWTNGGTA
jgi:hypothetical protein